MPQSMITRTKINDLLFMGSVALSLDTKIESLDSLRLAFILPENHMLLDRG
jgi:hypothetical protein